MLKETSYGRQIKTSHKTSSNRLNLSKDIGEKQFSFTHLYLIIFWPTAEQMQLRKDFVGLSKVSN